MNTHAHRHTHTTEVNTRQIQADTHICTRTRAHTRMCLTVTHLIPGSQHIWITAGWWGREGQAPPDWLASFKKAFLFPARLSDPSLPVSLYHSLPLAGATRPPPSLIWVASPPAQVNMEYAHLHLTQENDSSACASGAILFLQVFIDNCLLALDSVF